MPQEQRHVALVCIAAGVINDAIITPGWRSYTRKADYSYPMEECPVFD